MFYEEIFKSLESLIPDFNLFLNNEKKFETKTGSVKIEFRHFEKNIIIMYLRFFSKFYIYKIHINPVEEEAELMLPEKTMIKEKIRENGCFAKFLRTLASRFEDTDKLRFLLI